MTGNIKKEKIDALCSDMSNLVRQFKNWWYDSGGGPSLYFYQKTISRVRSEDLEDLLNDKSFIELLYATLTAWDMDARAASLEDFDKFRSTIEGNYRKVVGLCDYTLTDLEKKDLERVKVMLRNLYKNLSLMKSRGKLVSVSKFLHFTVPDLVMPMDRQNTLKYFYGNTGDSRKRFLEVFEASWQVAQEVNLAQYVDENFNLSGPKVIDNAINAKMRD